MRAKRRIGLMGIVLACSVLAATIADPIASADERSPAVAALDIAIPSEGDILQGLRGGHPRLIVTSDTLPALQLWVVNDPTTAAMYAAVKARANALLAVPPVTYTKPDGYRLLEVCREVVRRMYDLGLVWLVEGDPAMAARAWQELQTVIAFPDWNPIHFLDTAEMTHAVAIGYDWFYSALDGGQRAAIEQAIADKGLAPARDAYSGVAPLLMSYWVLADHNWNNVVNGGETMGALAIGDVYPQLSSYVAHEALMRIPYALDHYAPDGGWPEGVSYWEYATEYSGYLVTGLLSSLGTDFGLSDADGFASTGEVPIHMTAPTGQRYNWADDGEPRYAPSVPFMFWLSKRFGREAYRSYQLAHAEPAALDVVWYSPSAGAESLPLNRLFAGIDVSSTRQAWGDPNAWWVGAKGGRPGFNHNQLDSGSFALEALGERWAIDLGKENYNVPGYWEANPGGRRWTYYRSRAEGHNTLVLDPDACEDQDPLSTSKVVTFESASDGGFSITDLTGAYRGTPVRRGVGLFDQTRVVVQDELQLSQSTDIWWFMHTRATIQLTDGGRTAVLEQNGKELHARLLSPAGATFTVEDAIAMPSSPQPPENTANAGIRKLTVHLQASAPTTVLVVFDDGTGQAPQVTPLDQWRLAGTGRTSVTQAPVPNQQSVNSCKGLPAPTTTTTTVTGAPQTTVPSGSVAQRAGDGSARASTIAAAPAFTG